jgi:hypothetical protein
LVSQKSVRPKDNIASYINNDPAIIFRNVLLYFFIRDR